MKSTLSGGILSVIDHSVKLLRMHRIITFGDECPITGRATQRRSLPEESFGVRRVCTYQVARPFMLLAFLVLALVCSAAGTEDGLSQSRQQETGKPNGGSKSANEGVVPELVEPTNSGPYCGIYSLYVCLSALGIETRPGDYVATEYVGSYRGSTAKELVDAATDFGSHAECYSGLTIRELKRVDTPVILHMRSSWEDADFTHWVAFLGCDGDRMCIVDAPAPPQAITAAELLANWDGTAIVLSAGEADSVLLRRSQLDYLVQAGLVLVICVLLKEIVGDTKIRVETSRAVRFRTHCSHIVVLLAATMVLSLSYHSLAENGFLANPTAVAEVTRRHYAVDIPEISLAGMQDEIREDSLLLLDARHSSDYRRGALPGSQSMPVNSPLRTR